MLQKPSVGMCRDGLVRLAFTRKNKTLGAIFRQSRTLQLLEANHAVFQAWIFFHTPADLPHASSGMTMWFKHPEALEVP